MIGWWSVLPSSLSVVPLRSLRQRVEEASALRLLRASAGTRTAAATTAPREELSTKSSTFLRVSAPWQVREELQSKWEIIIIVPFFISFISLFITFNRCQEKGKLSGWMTRLELLQTIEASCLTFYSFFFLVTAENGWRCCLINRDRKTPTDYIRNGILYITEKWVLRLFTSRVFTLKQVRDNLMAKRQYAARPVKTDRKYVYCNE